MSYADYRSQPAPEDSPTLLLHGFLGRGSDWDGISSALDGGTLTPDLPGHGESIGLPENAYTMEGAAEAVVHLLDETDTQRCNIVGYSMGGRLALYLALKYPERFDSLILESSSPGLRTEKERRDRRTSDEATARRLEVATCADFRSFLEEWHHQPLFSSLAKRKGLVEKLISERIENSSKELARSLRGMGTGIQPSLWGELPELRVPTLAVVGEYDEKFVGIAREMSRLSENVEVEVVAGAGHNVHTEEPQEFIRLLKQCIRED